jgi:hypothetical protein
VIEVPSKSLEGKPPSRCVSTDGVNVLNYIRLRKASSTSSEGVEEKIEENKDVDQGAATNRVDDRKAMDQSEIATTVEDKSQSRETDSFREKPKAAISKRSKRSDDPISWYGILVPQSLRNAQKSFTTAIEGSVPQLTDVMIEMRDVELKIHNLRK